MPLKNKQMECQEMLKLLKILNSRFGSTEKELLNWKTDWKKLALNIK